MKLGTLSEELLLTVLWMADQVAFPSLRNLTESFETWQHRRGFHRQLSRLEQRQFVVRQERAGEIVMRLTETGRLAALGGKDLSARWDRRWDGQWRQVLFDLPVSQGRTRVRLWRWLRENGFGYLQQSLWIHPDPLPELSDVLRGFTDDVETFLLMEARCCGGYTDRAVVAGAWDFEEINRRHQAYLSLITPSVGGLAELRATPARLTAWLRAERLAWHHALQLDPLLPRPLWPARYLGERAWNTRLQTRRHLAQLFT